MTNAVATHHEIVACFNALLLNEVIHHNWGTCGRDCPANWKVTDETYINGCMMVLDFDYRMGYLVQAVDRTSGQCTYVAIVQYHGRRADGSIEHDFMVFPGTHTFFDRETYNPAEICKWAVDQIHSAIEAHDERSR